MISGGERLLQKLFLFIQLTFGVKIKVKNYHINYLKPCYIHCLLRPTLFFPAFCTDCIAACTVFRLLSNFASVCWSTKKTNIRFVQPILSIQAERVEYWESHIEVLLFGCRTLHLSRHGRSIWRKWFVTLGEAGKRRRESTMFTIACVIAMAKNLCSEN